MQHENFERSSDTRQASLASFSPKDICYKLIRRLYKEEEHAAMRKNACVIQVIRVMLLMSYYLVTRSYNSKLRKTYKTVAFNMRIRENRTCE